MPHKVESGREPGETPHCEFEGTLKPSLFSREAGLTIPPRNYAAGRKQRFFQPQYEVE